MHKLTTRVAAFAVGVLLTGVALQLAAGPAAAAPAPMPAPVCKTSATSLVDRADSGLRGGWAVDAITPTVKICQSVPAVPDLTVKDIMPSRALYPVTVLDGGASATIEGKSPVAGVSLAAGANGKIDGRFIATFTAQAAFKAYKAQLDGATLRSDGGLSTSGWVKAAWPSVTGSCCSASAAGTP